MKIQSILVLAAVFFLVVFSGRVSAQKYSGGTGELNNPYQISDANDMNEIGANPDDWDAHFVMVNDINLADYTGTNFNIIGELIVGEENPKDYPFTGVFDGNDHSLSNFTYTSTEPNFIGLFGYVGSTGRVKNLGMEDVNIVASAGSCIGGLVGYNKGTISDCYVTGTFDGASVAGGLAGVNNGGTISNCYATGSISGASNSTGGLVGENDRGSSILNCYAVVSVSGRLFSGGLAGTNSEGTITYCYAAGNVSGMEQDTGGLVGWNSFGAISHCYATGDVWGDNSTGGLIGDSYYGTISHCYATGEVSGNTKTGGLVGQNTLASYVSCFWNETVNPLLTGIGDEPDPPSVIGETTENMQTQSTYTHDGWDFVGDERPSDDWGMPGGTGYPILWWQMETLPPLPEFSGGMGTAAEPYVIASSNDLNDIGHNPRLMDKHFKLTDDINLFDESFYIIGNVGYPFVGIFDGNGHVISDFFLLDPDEKNYVGLFGFVAEGGEVKNLGLENVDIVVFDGFYVVVGGLVGMTEGTIINCYVNNGWVGGESRTGGLAGYNLGTISNCYAAGIVDGTGNTGGLVGGNDGAISNCHATGGVEGHSWYIGGLVGYNYGNGTISNSYATCIVIGDSYVGGLAGMNSSGGGTITKCYASGTVSGNSRVGGLVGTNHSGISSCYATGDSSGEHSTGGLVGTNDGMILDCYAWTSVNEGLYRTGGLVGTNYGIVSNSYASGAVSGDHYTGGLLGENWGGVISHCYSTGSVTGTDDTGGLVGLNNSSSYAGCFWNSDVNPDVNGIGNGSDPNVMGKTTAEMQTESTFTDAGWDFVGEIVNGPNDVWTIHETVDYPKHVWKLVNFVGWYEIDLLDYAFFANYWQDTNCGGANDCDGTDLDFSNTVDAGDLKIFCDHWLEGTEP